MAGWSRYGVGKQARAKIVAAAPTASRPVSAPTAPIATTARTVRQAPRATYITHYDPSRVIDIDKLKVVSDLRTEGSERGETQTGDSGITGPGSYNGVFMPPPQVAPTPKPKNELAPLAMLAGLAYLLFS